MTHDSRLKTPLVVVVGQTASGKSALAMELATKFNGEIICADARTVYKGMDIGTAKATADEQARVVHHLLDIITPDQVFSAADFKRLANATIGEIQKSGKLPILVGGTGLYIDAVVYNYSFAKLSAERDPQNPRHLSKTVATKKDELLPNTLIIGLEVDDETLKKRIKQRVQTMIAGGLRQEANQLVNAYGWDAPGMNTIGYKEWRILFSGETLDESKIEDLIVRNTWQYARRQKTYFKRNKSIHWAKEQGEAVDIATTFLYKN